MDYVDRMLMVAKIFSGSKMDLLPSAKTRDAWMLRSKRVLLLRDGSRTTTARCPMDGVRAVLFWLRGLEFAADAVGRECPSARYRFFDRLGSPLCISHARSEPPAVFPKPPREAACSTRPGGCRLCCCANPSGGVRDVRFPGHPGGALSGRAFPGAYRVNRVEPQLKLIGMGRSSVCDWHVTLWFDHHDEAKSRPCSNLRKPDHALVIVGVSGTQP